VRNGEGWRHRGGRPLSGVVDDTDEARDEYDRLRRRVLWTFPSGLYVWARGPASGATDDQNWVTQVSFEPKLVASGGEGGPSPTS